MEKKMYLMMIKKSKTYSKLTKQTVLEHVENIRKLDDQGKLEICGVFHGYPGMAGLPAAKIITCCNLRQTSRQRPAGCHPKTSRACLNSVPAICVLCKM